MSSTAKMVCDRESIYLSGSRCMTVCRRQLRWCVIERVFSYPVVGVCLYVVDS